MAPTPGIAWERALASVLPGCCEPGAVAAMSVVDGALARLAERSLLAFSLDGQAVIAHELVMRVVRDGLARQGRLAAVCRDAAALDTRARKRLPDHWTAWPYGTFPSRSPR